MGPPPLRPPTVTGPAQRAATEGLLVPPLCKPLSRNDFRCSGAPPGSGFVGQQEMLQSRPLLLGDAAGEVVFEVIGHQDGEAGAVGAEAVVDRRSDGRRVGTECVSPCRSRGSPNHKKTKQKQK